MYVWYAETHMKSLCILMIFMAWSVPGWLVSERECDGVRERG